MPKYRLDSSQALDTFLSVFIYYKFLVHLVRGTLSLHSVIESKIHFIKNIANNTRWFISL